MLLRFALGRKEEVIDGFDKQYLRMFGFSRKSHEDQLALADNAGACKKGSVGHRSVTTDIVVFVHCCCEKGNILSKPVECQGTQITDMSN